MKDEEKNRDQLLDEIKQLRQRLAQIEASGKSERNYSFTEAVSLTGEGMNSLEDLKEKCRIIVENANEAILIIQDGMIKFYNPQVAKMLGYSKSEIETKHFLDFIHPDDRYIVFENSTKEISRKKILPSHQIRIIDAQGNIVWAEVNAVSIDLDGRQATLYFLKNITEKRKIEEELIKAEKLESVGVLAGGIAHDFNNILTGILGNISFAKMVINQKEKALERLDAAANASLRAKELTQKLLTFSTGGLPIVKETSITDLIKNSIRSLLRGTNVLCQFSLPDDLWSVNVDELQINQVINNVVINAQQAMKDRGMIEVRAENVTLKPDDLLPLKAGKYVKILIKDHGIGIPEEDLPRIFDPYFTRKPKCAGLGLAIAHSIIKKHNGYIMAESVIGSGTIILIYLPASTE